MPRAHRTQKRKKELRLIACKIGKSIERDTGVPASMNPKEFTEGRILEMVAEVSAYMRQERDMYLRHSEPLATDLKEAIHGFFPQELLGRLKTITLEGGARIPPPPFYAEAKEMSGGRFPDFVHMRSITYIDVIVFHDQIDVRALFHGVVHATQMAVLGFDRYMELYVRGFVKNLSWLQIPLEEQAYRLDGRFAENPKEIFSVEEEVTAWLRGDRYL